jgi:GntR family transcriptional regulator
LTAEFGVSPGTMRKAFDLMESERLLTRKQGRGTFINDPAADGLAVRFSNIRNSRSRRITGDVRADTIVQAPESAIVRLRLQGLDEVYRVRRFRIHEGRLSMVEDAALPAALFPGLLQQPSVADRVVVLARHYGVLLSRSPRTCVNLFFGESHYGHTRASRWCLVLCLDHVGFALDGRPVMADGLLLLRRRRVRGGDGLKSEDLRSVVGSQLEIFRRGMARAQSLSDRWLRYR